MATPFEWRRAARLPTDDSDFLGWIIVAAQRANDRILDLFAEHPESAPFRKELEIRERPFLVLVLELSRDVHERGDYETEEDYRKKERFRCRTLEEVEEILARYDLTLSELEDPRKVDAP